MGRGCEYINMTKKLIEDNKKLVYYIINQFYPNLITDEDIVQCGMLGLCRAANTWDESKSKFNTFAGRCIRNEINHELYRRNKHKGVLSLDYEYSDSSGDDITLQDMIVGQDDVDYVDIDSIYQQLSPIERDIVDLRRKGMTIKEIAKQVGCCYQNVSKHLRKIKTKIE